MPLPSAPITKALHYTVTANSAADGEASVTITTGSPDRHRDKVAPQGIALDTYKKNPVVLFGHDYYAIPVGTCTAIESSADGLKASWKWLQGDPMADRVKNAWDQGVLRAASIGFMPTKWAYDEERRGYDYLEAELLEFSIVSVPANADAVRQLKALGLPTDDTQTQIVSIADDIAALKAALIKDDQHVCAKDAKGDCPMGADCPMQPKSMTADDADDFFTLDPDPDDQIALSAEDVTDAMRAVLDELVRPAINKALLAATGRID